MARAGSSMGPEARIVRRYRAARHSCCICCPMAQSNSRRPDAMVALSTADHRHTPPDIRFPSEYNAACDLLERNLEAGRADKIASSDDRASCTYGDLAERVNRFAN